MSHRVEHPTRSRWGSRAEKGSQRRKEPRSKVRCQLGDRFWGCAFGQHSYGESWRVSVCAMWVPAKSMEDYTSHVFACSIPLRCTAFWIRSTEPRVKMQSGAILGCPFLSGPRLWGGSFYTRLQFRDSRAKRLQFG